MEDICILYMGWEDILSLKITNVDSHCNFKCTNNIKQEHMGSKNA